MSLFLISEVERLLLRSSDSVIPSRRFHFEDSQLRVRFEIGYVLGCDEYKLSMIHRLGYFHEIIHGNLSGDRIKEDIEFVHDAEGSLEAFADGEEE